jgi:hypothetical protein
MIQRITFLIILLCLSVNVTQVVAKERELLYPADINELSPNLQEIVRSAQNLAYPKIPYEALTSNTNYFVRIAPRKYTLTAENQISDSAILGTKPFVFFTTPEGIYGKSLLDIYLDIGYEAEDIIHWQRDTDMVAIIFNYPKNVSFSDVKNGELPMEWTNKVYAPTWDNVMTIFYRLTDIATVEPNKKGEFAPNQLFFNTPAQKYFVLSFPTEGLQRVKTTSYSQLKAVGGSDWVYRDLLEKKLSIFEHFRGNGRTLNEIVDPAGVQREAGLFEFVGPNSPVKSLPEVAIMDLGQLTIANTYP